MTILVSPTETRSGVLALFAEGEAFTHSLPETYGADFLIPTLRGLVGAQRKAFPSDFLASIEDGRLMREVQLLQSLAFRVLIKEGEADYTHEGNLILDGVASRWTWSTFENLDHSLWYYHGVRVIKTKTLEGTVEELRTLRNWFNQEVHRSLLVRPKEGRDEWSGRPDKRSWARYFLQGFPGIGPERAEAIFDHFKRVPLKWIVNKRELKEVFGVGDKTADALFAALDQEE